MDQVFLMEIFFRLMGDVRATRIAVFFGHGLDILLDDQQDFLRAGQQVLQVGDAFEGLLLLVFDLLPFQGSQATELHIQDSLRLPFAQREAAYQALFGSIGVGGIADGGNDLIQVLQSDQQAGQDMGALTRFGQVKLRAAANHLFAMLDKDLQRTLQRKQARHAIHQRQQLHAESRLQGGVLVQLIQYFFGLGAAFQFNDDAHAAPVGFISQIGDAIDPLAARQVGDALEQAGFVQLVGDFGNHDPVPAANHLFDMRLAAQHNPAATRCYKLARCLHRPQ